MWQLFVYYFRHVRHEICPVSHSKKLSSFSFPHSNAEMFGHDISWSGKSQEKWIHAFHEILVEYEFKTESKFSSSYPRGANYINIQNMIFPKVLFEIITCNSTLPTSKKNSRQFRC